MASDGAALNNPRTVWILGAGFSRFLGGPLLDDLLRHRHALELLGLTSGQGIEQSDCQNMEHASRLFQIQEHLAVSALWRNAEEFLEKVSQALENPDSPSGIELAWRIKAAHFRLSIDDLYDATLRSIILETTAFLRGLNIESERLRPYLTWARSLTDRDTVISFNYDGLPHLLAQDPDTSLAIVGPKGELADGDEGSKARVLHLHGCSLWRGESIEAIGSPSLQLPREVSIGIPGPGKLGISRHLEVIWSEARAAIENADRLIVVGYSFPVTDMNSLEMIYESVSKNTDLGQLSVVLGEGDTLGHKARIMRMFSQARRSRGMFTSQQNPLFLYDFNMRAEEFLLIHHPQYDPPDDACLNPQTRGSGDFGMFKIYRPATRSRSQSSPS